MWRRRQPTTNRVNIEQSASGRLEGRVLQYSIFWLGFITGSKHCIFRFYKSLSDWHNLQCVGILPAWKCLHCAYLYHWRSIFNVFQARMCAWYLSFGSVSRNTVSRGVFPNTHPREQEGHVIPVASEYQEIHPYSVVNVSNVKINT